MNLLLLMTMDSILFTVRESLKIFECNEEIDLRTPSYKLKLENYIHVL